MQRKCFLSFLAICFAPFLAISAAHATCAQEIDVDCRGDCTWGYNADTDSYFPKAYTITVAQTAASTPADDVCEGTLIVVYGTKTITAAGYAMYFFEFAVDGNLQVAFDGNSDVSHDQRPLPPAKHPGSIQVGEIVYGIDIVIPSGTCDPRLGC
jgi:hypothetical protein